MLENFRANVLKYFLEKKWHLNELRLIRLCMAIAGLQKRDSCLVGRVGPGEY